IGNGDVFTPETFKKRLEESSVDYIMIARGAIGNPDIFRQMNDFLKKGNYTPKDRRDQFTDYMTYAKKYETSFALIKEHAMGFTKGMVGSAKARAKMGTAKTLEEIEALVASCGKLQS
ncbi:MAG: tRNA-dihydrouridine synthase, partial [Nanoarchaeota archaeon]|nr:tRNA-dihydrouridine synthase [Nanoarchaeota archaeon]